MFNTKNTEKGNSRTKALFHLSPYLVVRKALAYVS